MNHEIRIEKTQMPGSLQILVSSFFVFGDVGCMIFFKMVSICKARLLKNVNKHFPNFFGQNQRKIKMGRKAQKKKINHRYIGAPEHLGILEPTFSTWDV